MTLSERRYVNRLSLAAYSCICLALGLVVLLGVWGAFRDVRAARETALRTEIATMRSHAVRTVGRIEHGLEHESARPKLESVRDDPWIRQFWLRVIPRQGQRLYAAIVDADGTVLMHSDSQFEGRRVTSDVFDPAKAPDLAADVFETRSQALADGRRAFDVRVPIDAGGKTVGHYHAGLDVDWFEDQAAYARRQILRRWAMVISGISVVVLFAGMSLYYIAYRSAAMRNVADMVQLQRVTELGQVAAGLAHEIRNPLHAIRLNLHSLGRMQNGNTKSSEEEIATIIRQSNDEIARLDRLVEELLGFAKPDEAREEDIDLVSELRATLNFIHPEMESNKVEMGTEFRADTAVVHMDAARFRQIMLNLLMNAKEALDGGGQINVALARRDDRIEVRVSDDGPGISEEDREQMFDPFYTTKESGSGLGLPLVKRFVEEASGQIDCESNETGTTFRISLPLVIRAK